MAPRWNRYCGRGREIVRASVVRGRLELDDLWTYEAIPASADVEIVPMRLE